MVRIIVVLKREVPFRTGEFDVTTCYDLRTCFLLSIIGSNLLYLPDRILRASKAWEYTRLLPRRRALLHGRRKLRRPSSPNSLGWMLGRVVKSLSCRSKATNHLRLDLWCPSPTARRTLARGRYVTRTHTMRRTLPDAARTPLDQAETPSSTRCNARR